MNKLYIFVTIVILACILSADDPLINVSAFNNSTTLLSYNSCYNITDGINWIYLCAPNTSKWNINMTLDYNQTISNSTLNATISSPGIPMLNVSQNLSFGQNYSNTMYNISILCPTFPKINLARFLTYSEIYSNADYNLTLIAPAITTVSCNSTASAALFGGQTYNATGINISCSNLLMNISRNMDFGDVYNDTTNNITLYAPKFPGVNQRISLIPGQTATSYTTDVRFNYSFYCNSSIIANDNALSMCNNQLQILNDRNTNQNKEINNLTVQNRELTRDLASACPTPAAVPCKNVTTVAQTNSLLSSIANVTCNSPLQVICPDNVGSYCSVEEKLKGNYASCINRVINDTSSQISTCQNTLAATQLSETQCKQGQQTNQDFLTLIVEALCVLVIVIGVAWYLVDSMHQRKIEEGD